SWDADAIDFARVHPDRFGSHALPTLDASQLRGLTTYARFADRAPASDVHTMLAAFDGTGFPEAVDDVAARVLGVPVALVAELRASLTLQAPAVAALDQLDRAAQLARTLAVSGDALVALAGDAYAPLSRAADQLAATSTAVAYEPIREAKRDALASYLLHSLSPASFTSIDKLYEYFLIDVSSGGCSTTSRLVAATTSAQLYVHRVLMNLEQDGRPTTDPDHVALRMPVDAAAEWEWRKNYRVWQANRSVFLWPENYLEPDLRDDKTPLFLDLEQELLQTEISDQNVLDAYTKYLAGLEEVGSLALAGAYHQVGATSDVLHLFGVSAGDPATYYYRTCENLRRSRRDPNAAAVWSAWQKLTVQITGRKVSPIVHRGRLHVFWIDIKTKPVSRVVDGSSEFGGYSHAMTLRFTTLRPDGAWTTPQAVQLPSTGEFGPGRGQIRDALNPQGIPYLDPQRRVMAETIEDYTVDGANWDWCWPESTPSGLHVRFRDFREYADLDLFKRTAVTASWPQPGPPTPQLLCARTGGGTRSLYAGTPWWMFWTVTGFANLLVDEHRIDIHELEASGRKAFFQLDQFYKIKIATIPADSALLAVPGSESDVMLQSGSDLLYLDGSERNDGGYVVHRLGTTLIESIARRLFEDGLDSVLDTQTQLALAEAGIPLAIVAGKALDHSKSGTLDFAGPYGGYYRELYLHIPFLIANALHSRGRFAAAQRWYNYIFDPASTEIIGIVGVPAAEVAHRLLDRVWRYREFRGLDLAHVRDVLSDPSALALYRRDPFNPWAIARRRPSAIQQTIVMKYVANLLDWADSLFAQFTMESVNEALMLYVTAHNILGPRPVELGDC
ncbi:MAG TPA: neuraminidase-like domain-containing protein, partial [Kofleriaceae bacterium]|nr:neuraminidase-like domain-containing protein [Kofleriaceae bacterium]